jgi:hypothetical protein
MSLLSNNEICKGCKNAGFYKDIFIQCKINKEGDTNGYNGSCESKESGVESSLVVLEREELDNILKFVISDCDMEAHEDSVIQNVKEKFGITL